MSEQNPPPPPYPEPSDNEAFKPPPPPYPTEPTTVPMYGQADIVSGQPPVVVHDHNTTYVYGPNAMAILCPRCHVPVQTEVDHTISMIGWIAAMICCLLGLWLCCWIPLVMTSFREVKHRCPNCKANIGIYRR